jgi:hypothetical protein
MQIWSINIRPSADGFLARYNIKNRINDNATKKYLFLMMYCKYCVFLHENARKHIKTATKAALLCVIIIITDAGIITKTEKRFIHLTSP